MRSSDLKEYIVEQEHVITILEDLGCGHIVKHDGYITCSNPDGNNKSAVNIYLNENLTTINHTRSIAKNKQSADLFDLVSFYKDCTFPEALKYVHSVLGLDFYEEREEPCEALQILRMLNDMRLKDEEGDKEQVKPIDEKILDYYLPYGNKMFEDDGISLDVQEEFGVMYDPQTNRITIPIRSPIGDLCGIKGRLFGDPDEYSPKYLYIEPVAKSKVLFGLYENKEYIKNSNQLFILESEKSPMQLASNGVRNCVALGGKSISKTQAELIIRTGCTPIIALDKGIDIEEIYNVASVFPDNVPVYYIFDTDNILDDKESPSDNFKKFRHLVENNMYAIQGGGDNEDYKIRVR